MTRKNLALIAAVSMTVGGLGYCGSAQAQYQSDDRTTGQKMKDTAEQTGQSAQKAAEEATGATQPSAMGGQVSPDSKEIRRDLGKITQEALSRNPIDSLSSYLDKSTRDRFSKEKPTNTDAVNGTIQAFKSDWQSKYNHAFDFSKDRQDVALADCQILQGYIGETAQPAGGQITPSGQQPGQMSDQSKVSDQSKMSDQSAQQAAATDKKHATVVIPADAQHNLPQLTLHLVNEGTLIDEWRLQLPETLTAEQVQSNLKDHLYAVGQDKANWPSDPNEAYRLVAHHVFAALEGTSTQGAAIQSSGRIEGQSDQSKQPYNQPSQSDQSKQPDQSDQSAQPK